MYFYKPGVTIQPMERWITCELIFFDCDSTLSTIEGSDELARMKGKELRVGVLTDKAMNGDLDLAEVYGKRLKAIRPTRLQLEAIKDRYAETLVEDAQEVIDALHFIKRKVFIISGGLLDAVRGFGEHLGVRPECIRAVELEYDELAGEWWRYNDHSSEGQQRYLDYGEGPLTVTSGKPDIVRELAGDTWGRRMMIGDGASDLATRGNGVDIFVGFGGVVAREQVKKGADVFIHCASISPVLPLAAGALGLELVTGTSHEAVFRKGLDLALAGDNVTFHDETMRRAFQNEFETA